jgi:hypothetical protein
VETLDLAHRPDDAGDARREAVDRALDRTQGVVHRVLEVADHRVRRERHQDERHGQQRDEDDRPAAGGPGGEEGRHLDDSQVLEERSGGDLP